MKGLEITISVPLEIKTKNEALGYIIKRIKGAIDDYGRLSGYTLPLGDIELVAMQSAIKFTGATSHGTFSAAIRRYEKATGDRVISIDTVQLSPDDTSRKLYFAEQIRRVKSFVDALDGKGPFPIKDKNLREDSNAIFLEKTLIRELL